MRRYSYIAVVTACMVASFACEEPLDPIIAGKSLEHSDSLTFTFGGTVDIIDGIRYYRNVQVQGTLAYSTTFFDEASGIEEQIDSNTVGVSLFVTMWFKRSDDYQGVSQYWHAGGKSYELLSLAQDGTAMTHRRYLLGGVENTAFVNIEYLIERSDVLIHNIWISYEY